MTDEELIKMAKKARENAYAPYSHFKVGAALLGENKQVYFGCNVENASYGGTICAERTAFLVALSQGNRNFQKIAIVGAKEGEEAIKACPPCGICRQFMSEFCSKDFNVVLEEEGEICSYSLGELLPVAFAKEEI